MGDIEKHRIQEINDLHNEIGDYLKMSLEKAIEIGRLLVEQKQELKHGEWLLWVKNNLPFSDRTARAYMRCFQNREKLADSANLDDALKLLAEPTKATDEMTPEKAQRECAKLKGMVSDLDELDKEVNTFVDSPENSYSEKVEALQNLIERAEKVETTAAELHIRTAREIGRILNETDLAGWIYDHLKTDYYEPALTGLKKLRPTEKKEWLEYAQRLREVDEALKSFKRNLRKKPTKP